jgi:hypothetical protein
MVALRQTGQDFLQIPPIQSTSFGILPGFVDQPPDLEPVGQTASLQATAK